MLGKGWFVMGLDLLLSRLSTSVLYFDLLRERFWKLLLQWLTRSYLWLLSRHDFVLCVYTFLLILWIFFQMGFFAEAGPVQVFVSNHVSGFVLVCYFTFLLLFFGISFISAFLRMIWSSTCYQHWFIVMLQLNKMVLCYYFQLCSSVYLSWLCILSSTNLNTSL